MNPPATSSQSVIGGAREIDRGRFIVRIEAATPITKSGDVAECLRSSLWQGAMVSVHLRTGSSAFVVPEKVERVSCSRH